MKSVLLRYFLILFTIFFLSKNCKSQDTIKFLEPATQYNKNRVNLLAAGTGSVYILSMAGLYTLWYRDYPTSNFRTFDDSKEWLQVDKVGHLGSAYYISKWGMDMTRWTGINNKKSVVVGGTMGLAFLTTIEIFDGFSTQWGFSTSDMVANVTGTAFAVSQQLIWNEQRLSIKFSYRETKYPVFRPDQLGEEPLEKLFKDYNGQTYWLSGNIKSFLNKDSKFPAWLNIAVGYGADGMTGAIDNDSPFTLGNNNFIRTRQWYIAPDIDLSKIKTKSPLLKTIFNTIGFLKFPAPAIEFKSKGKTALHLIYF